jgi:hypothetical protein
MTRSSTKHSSPRRTSRAPQPAHGTTAGKPTTMEASGSSETKAKRSQRKGHDVHASDAYETWLDHRLKSLYQPMLDAALPDDMLKLVRGRKPS